MKKIIGILAFLLTQFNYGQTINIFPIDENGKVHYSKIIEVENLNKEQIYNKTKLYFVNNFKSGKDVIQMEDKDNGVIVGNGNTTIVVQSGKYSLAVPMSFSIKLSSKDYKCKIDISNIVYNSTSPAEVLFNDKAEENYLKAKDKAKAIMESYRDQTLEKLTFLETKLKEELLKKEENW